MSEQNVDIVKRGWAAWMGGDLDALLATCDPAIEWDTTNFDGWPENDIYYGHQGFRRFLDEWLATWERFEAGADEYIDVDRDRVLVVCWQRGFGHGSHVPVQMDYAVVCTLEGGLVCGMEVYSDREAALEAVGLSK